MEAWREVAARQAFNGTVTYCAKKKKKKKEKKKKRNKKEKKD